MAFLDGLERPVDAFHELGEASQNLNQAEERDSMMHSEVKTALSSHKVEDNFPAAGNEQDQSGYELCCGVFDKRLRTYPRSPARLSAM